MSIYLSPAQAERVVLRYRLSLLDFYQCIANGYEFPVKQTKGGNSCFICENLNSTNDTNKFFYILNI